jgi:short-subunit dehydrogenase
MDVTRALLPHFRSNLADTSGPSPGIINISSSAGKVGIPILSLYASSKFAVEGFTEALSYELRGLPGKGIWVKSVLPTSLVTATNMHARSETERMQGGGPADYDGFMKEAYRASESLMGQPSMTAHDAALGVWDAVEDARGDDVEKKRKLRYFVGHDAGGIVKAREESVTDEEYLAKLRGVLGFSA